MSLDVTLLKTAASEYDIIFALARNGARTRCFAGKMSGQALRVFELTMRSRESGVNRMHAREKFAAVPESISEDPSQPASWLAAGGEIGKKPSSGGRR